MTNHFNCATCHFLMTSHDNRPICRHNGLDASPANADGCTKYLRETGSDDEPLVFMGEGIGWVLECEAGN